MSWWSRVANVFRTERLDRELDAELQFHLSERVQELKHRGMTTEAAAAHAARRFGDPARWREESRDVKRLPWPDVLGRDIRYGIRSLRKHAVVTATAVVSLALALGACVAAFSLIDALILRPLPVQRPERLVYLTFATSSPERPEADTFNDPLFLRLRDAGRGHVDLFAMSTQVMRPAMFTAGNDEKERVRTQYVSGDAFDRLGITPAAGRLLSPHDDTIGGQPVAVVSHAFWLRRFGGDPTIVGRWFTLEEKQFQIVGVSQPRFSGVEPGRPTDIWLPYAAYNPRAFGNFQFNWFRIVGRLGDDASIDQARGVLHAAFTHFRREFAPREFGPNGTAERIARFIETPLFVRPAANGPSPLRQQFERPLWILVAIAALVLLIAGSNVANLFLARTAAREREMALRLSIGAGRFRLVQQLLVESALVGSAACGLGLLFAALAAPVVTGMLAPPDDPVSLDLRLDSRVLAFACFLAIALTAVFGVAPALRASAVAPIAALRQGGPGSGARAGMMRPFVAIQFAFGLAVLFVGGLLVLSFARLASVNPGFATTNVLLLSLETVTRVDQDERRAALLEVLDRLRDVPGVQAVSAAEFNLLGRAWTHNTRMPGTQPEFVESTIMPVTHGFFETMNISVLEGRTFDPGDFGARRQMVVVNEAFAARYFGDSSAVGRRLETRFGDASDSGSHEVIGVVSNTRYDLRKPAAPTVYIPLPRRSLGTIHARIAGNPDSLVPRLREEIRTATPLFRVTSTISQSTFIDRTLLRERLLALLAAFFAAVGLALVALGVYGVLAYSVVQKTREIGIRVALGARELSVVRAVLAETGVVALVGAVAGLIGGVYASRFVQSLLFEVTPLDFWSLALPLGVMLAAATLAATLPAWRATRVDPVIALRYE